MGFFDTILGMFGVGGASLAITLDADQVPQGGFLSGKITVTGGEREQQMNALKVRLLFVSVKSREDSAIPDINTQTLLDVAVATNKTIAPKSTEDYPFQLQIPAGTEATAHNVSYTVLAAADIPGAKDPSAKRDLKVVESSGQTADEILRRWPALRGTEEGPLVDAIRDMRWKHRDGDEDKDLLAAEPVLARLIREGSPRAKVAAIETWAEILKERATPGHVRVLIELAEGETPEDNVLRAVIDAAGAFRKPGGMTVLKKFAAHEDPKVREMVAGALDSYDGPFIGDDLELLRTMIEDPHGRVRCRVVQALGTYWKNTSALERIAKQADHDADVDVLEACIRALSSAGWRERPELLVERFERFSHRPEARIREAVANAIPTSDKVLADARIKGVIDRLLADPEEDVRHQMAFQLNNLVQADDTLADTALLVIRNDPSQRVKGAAVSALCKDGLVEKIALPAYEALLGADASEEVLRGMVFGLRFREEEPAKMMLHRLSAHPNRNIAERAKEALSN